MRRVLINFYNEDVECEGRLISFGKPKNCDGKRKYALFRNLRINDYNIEHIWVEMPPKCQRLIGKKIGFKARVIAYTKRYTLKSKKDLYDYGLSVYENTIYER